MHVSLLPAGVAIAVLALPVLAAAQPAPLASATPTTAASPGPSASSQPAGSPSPATGAPATDEARLARARTEFLAWQSASISLDRYIDEARAQFTPQAVAQISATYLKPLGALRSFTLLDSGPYNGITVYTYRATGTSGAIDELISWNGAGKIQFIVFRPLA